MTKTATIDQLKPGSEYPGGNINARVHYTDDEIQELAASLKGIDGQLRPLFVATHPKKPELHYVFGGGRRLIAFRRLIDGGDLPKTHPIDIIDFGNVTSKDALSKSLADNKAVPMHPADQAATFALLAADRAPEDIARERGMTVRAVQQSIALGAALIPPVIKMWREGKFTRENVEILTTADHDQQAEALQRIKEGDFDPTSVMDWEDMKKRISANKGPEMARLLGFVGAADYRAAGGVVTEDFFGAGGVVKDLKLLNKLANAKLKTLVQAELDAGWSWCEGKLGERRRMHHGFGEAKAVPQFTAEENARLAAIDKRVKAIRDIDMPSDAEDREQDTLEAEAELIETEAKARAYTDKQKAGAGVLIYLRRDGTPEYVRGLIRQAEKKQAKRQGGAANYAQREQEPITWDAKRALSDWQNWALGDLLIKHPKDAMAALLAGVVDPSNDTIINPASLEDSDDKFKVKSFAEAFEKFRKLSLEKMGDVLLSMTPACVDISSWNGGRKKDAAVLIKIVGEKEFQAAMRGHFDPKKYLNGASKKHMLGVVAEAFGEVARKEAEAKADDAVRKSLLDGLAKTGWLPPELRTSLYVKPEIAKGAATVTKLKPKAKPAKASKPKRKAA